jgi:hypothetical protein
MIGIVYEITCNNNNDIRYIGSTMQTLNSRYKSHLTTYNKYLKNKSKKVSIYPYFEKYGVENFTIQPLKAYNVADKKGIRVYEQLWIQKTKNINAQNAFGIKYLLGKNEYKKRKENNYFSREWRDAYNKRRRENYDPVKQHLVYKKIGKEYGLQRYHANKDEINTRRKESRDVEKNKKIRIEKTEIVVLNKGEIRCECGIVIVKRGISMHFKTKKHDEYLKFEIQ